VRAKQGRAWITGEEVTYESTRRWARRALAAVNHHQVVALNLDPAPWIGLIEHEPFLDFDFWGNRWVSDLDGRPLDYQLVQPEAALHAVRLLFPLHIPAGGAVQTLIRTDPAPERTPVTTDLIVTSDVLANAHLRVELDGRGVRRLLVRGRNVLGERGIRLHLREDHTDTWTFHTDRFDEPVAAEFLCDGWIVEETGPLRARVRAEGWLGRSWVRWTLSLCRDDPRLHLLLETTFAERYTALQLPIHLASTPSRWTDGLAGGSVERRPNPAEWPVLGWSRVEVGGQPLALVTNDAYSLSLDGDVWQWTLLRSPRMAWGGGDPEVYAGRDWHTDQGPHIFAFLLHVAGQLDDAALHAAARQQAQPPIVFDRYEGLQRPPWGSQPPRLLWTDAEERAYADGKLTLRPGDDQEG
jgi:alpha-mannosidase